MKRGLLCALGLLTLLAGSSLLVSDAGGLPQCRCSFATQQTGTGTVGGSGYSGPSSCAAAENQLLQQLLSQTNCNNGSCNEQLVITQQCQMDDPKWYPVSGYLVYGCEIFC